MPIVQLSKPAGAYPVETPFLPESAVVRGADYDQAVTDITNLISAVNTFNPSSGVLVSDNGTVNDPGLQVGQDANGFFRPGSGQISISMNNVGTQAWTNTEVLFGVPITNYTSAVYAPFIPLGTVQALSGAGTINITSYQTQFTSTATGNALVISDGLIKGHLKRVSYIAEAAGADTGVLSGTNLVATSITFNAVGDYAVLAWNGTKWGVIEYSGVTIV